MPEKEESHEWSIAEGEVLIQCSRFSMDGHRGYRLQFIKNKKEIAYMYYHPLAKEIILVGIAGLKKETIIPMFQFYNIGNFRTERRYLQRVYLRLFGKKL